MSLPWRYASADDYVAGTIAKLSSTTDDSSSVVVRHLKIGKFYLHGSPSLRTDQAALLLRAGRNHPYLEELTVCGVNFSGDSLSAFVELLRSDRTNTSGWKKVTLNNTDQQAILALTTPSLLDHFVPIETISITRSRLGCQGFQSLASLLASNPTLQKLEITEETVNHSSAVALAEGLKATKSLTTLELSYCVFQEHAVGTLATGVRQNTSLQSLLLPGCELEDDQLAMIVTSLQNHPTMQQLTLFRNHCSIQGTEALALLQNNSSSKISKLDLSYQQFERSKKLDIASIADSLSTTACLQRLSLSFNKLNNMDVQKLAEGLYRNDTLQQIDLRANNIRDDGVCALARVLKRHPSLEKVFLFGNPFGSIGAESLLTVARENTRLLELNTDYNASSYDSVQYYCCLNRGGRHLLKADVPPAFWPLIFCRAKKVSESSRGVCSAADIIYHLLNGSSVLERRRR